ncbi:MAG: SIMPL domain-containing protein [Deltaproteobacteria bacterium]|nr:SIMPL domain-containing protein [Deltaproteobacteria bacterium]
MKNTGAAIIAAAIIAACFAGCEPSYTFEQPDAKPKTERTLTVTGIARLEVEPDEATVSFTFTSSDKKMRKAHKKNIENVDRFLAALEEAGVSSKNVVLGRATYSPDYVYPEGKPAKIAGFTDSTTLQVKTQDFKKIPEIIDAGVDNNATSLTGVEFYSTKLPEHKKKVRDMAIKAARDKAKQIADGFDIKIGKAVNVFEGSWNSGISRWGGPFAGNEWSMSTANVAQQVGRQSGSEEMFGPISPGTTKLDLTIDCVFEIL